MYNGRANLNLLLKCTLRESGDEVKLYRNLMCLFFAQLKIVGLAAAIALRHAAIWLRLI